MNDSDKTTQPSESAVLRLWQRIPVLIRALVLGLLVSLIGVFAWQVILVLIPQPWSVVVMGGVLWLYWKYFSRCVVGASGLCLRLSPTGHHQPHSRGRV